MQKDLKEGWIQFLQNKIEILNSYHDAKVKTSGRPVKVEHGNVAEAKFRKWLSDFLPKRYGVTSGYIISQADIGAEKINHFDVIIYDQLNCPILWRDYSPDKTEEGQSKAIPVEYVHGVLEIKSTLNTKSIKEGLLKLEQLTPFLRSVDSEEEKYKVYLPKNFFSCLVFFELDKKKRKNPTFLKNLVFHQRGFYGAVILSAEDLEKKYTGIVQMLVSETEIKKGVFNKILSFSPRETLPYGSAHSDSSENEGKHYAMNLEWSTVNFSKTAFDFLALLDGTYKPGYSSSFHGMGFGIQNPKIDSDPNASV